MMMENNRKSKENDETSAIYFAGGCFWGMEKLMQSIPGVIKTMVGYANGISSVIPDYKVVSSGKSGYRETVRAEYDPKKNQSRCPAVFVLPRDRSDPQKQTGK
eukprot:TRINITY_DN15597_c0_g1_i1.p2 TRINITY_DN15597_c0_g1~~TRINITY_DN15597_c0_g1_i1.p2  ORF type:complete len:103 (+),score=14.03 TRINITY_DN15597_c0_g1_i1:373-681(+)